MLTLRLQRTGRKKLAQYRLIAQEHTLSPTSGKVAAYLGNYDPHTKTANFKKEEVEKHLANGAQPSNRVAILLKKEGYKLPEWVVIKTKEAKKEEAPAEEPAEKSDESQDEAKAEEAKQEAPKEESKDKEDSKESDSAEDKKSDDKKESDEKDSEDSSDKK